MLRPRTPSATAGAVVLAAVAAVVLYAVDPTRYWVTPPCPYLTLTGWACPGCGLTRSVHFLLHGQLATAFSYNPWVFVSAPAGVVFWMTPRLTDETSAVRVRTALAWGMLACTLAFWVWRNTDVYPFIRV